MLLYFFRFACNDVAGCPVPSLLSPSTLDWETLKGEIGWPQGGVRDLCSWEVMGVVLAYYLVSLILWRVLPAQEILGTKLVHHGRPLRYRLNGEDFCTPIDEYRPRSLTSLQHFRPAWFSWRQSPLAPTITGPILLSGPT